MHLLEQYICKIDNKEYIYILDVLNSTTDLTMGTRYHCVKKCGNLVRYRHGDHEISVLPYDEQIKIYNEYFYKFMPIPEHLKKFIKEEEKK